MEKAEWNTPCMQEKKEVKLKYFWNTNPSFFLNTKNQTHNSANKKVKESTENHVWVAEIHPKKPEK